MKVFYLLLALAFVNIAAKQPIKRLKKSISKETAIDGTINYSIVKDYNELGQLVRHTYAQFSNKPIQITNYTLDIAKGRILTDSVYNAQMELEEANSYDYDAFDQIRLQQRNYVKRKDYYEERYENEYNDAGRLIKQTEFDKENVLQWVNTYEYDKDYNETKSFRHYQGRIREEWLKEYKEGRCIKESLYDYENEDTLRTANTHYFYEYNKRGQKIKTLVHSVAPHLKRKIVTWYEYEYDKHGNEIEERYFSKGALESIIYTTNSYW